MGAGGRPWHPATATIRATIPPASRALPKLAVFSDREPVFSVTGPSALVSWLEPVLLMWSYRIQVATLALLRPEELAGAVGTVTCDAQKALVLETLDALRHLVTTRNVLVAWFSTALGKHGGGMREGGPPGAGPWVQQLAQVWKERCPRVMHVGGD
jgi:hypothetical protein